MKKEKGLLSKVNFKWIIFISFWTFILAGIFTIVSEKLVEVLNIYLSFLVLTIIIFIGIIFDIIGIAVTTAEEKPFHAMAANRVLEARYAIKLVRNASQVSNFCNDVIGDICGIISGAVGSNIIFNILKIRPGLNGGVLSLITTSLIAAVTVGGKAFGKTIAIEYSEETISIIAKILYFLEDKFKIIVLKEKD